MEIFIFISIAFLLILVWLNIIASIAIKYDHTLDSFQKKAQLLIVWLLPVLGSSFVLKMVLQHSPESIPIKLIPWPFKKALFGNRSNKSNYPEENEADGYNGRLIKNNPNYKSTDTGDSGSD